jgi:proteic killer suppression protein
VITSFGDQGTEDVFSGVDSKAAGKVLPKALWPVGRRKLDMLNAAAVPADLMVPPGNRFEKLKGSLTGCFSIRVNDQYRVVFKFHGGEASEVRIEDYH